MTQTKTARMTRADYIAVLRQELAPATGCTEPVAIAYAVAKAASFLSGPVESIQVSVSRNMMKNAMAWAFPARELPGSTWRQRSARSAGTPTPCSRCCTTSPRRTWSRRRNSGSTTSRLRSRTRRSGFTSKPPCAAGKDTVTVVIQGSHTNIVKITKNGETLFQGCDAAAKPAGAARVADLSVEGICRFVSGVSAEELSFLRETVELNRRIAAEGVTHNYGLRVGKTAYEAVAHSGSFDDGCDYAAALAGRRRGCPHVRLPDAGGHAVRQRQPGHHRHGAGHRGMRLLPLFRGSVPAGAGAELPHHHPREIVHRPPFAHLRLRHGLIHRRVRGRHLSLRRRSRAESATPSAM